MKGPLRQPSPFASLETLVPPYTLDPTPQSSYTCEILNSKPYAVSSNPKQPLEPNPNPLGTTLCLCETRIDNSADLAQLVTAAGGSSPARQQRQHLWPVRGQLRIHTASALHPSKWSRQREIATAIQQRVGEREET